MARQSKFNAVHKTPEEIGLARLEALMTPLERRRLRRTGYVWVPMKCLKYTTTHWILIHPERYVGYFAPYIWNRGAAHTACMVRPTIYGATYPIPDVDYCISMYLFARAGKHFANMHPYKTKLPIGIKPPVGAKATIPRRKK